MVDLDAIERRVRATIRESKGNDGVPIVERIISDADFEALLRLARRAERPVGGAGGGDDPGVGGGGG